ncbi:hypothetical protein PENTCL1PPCAC_3872, partial [Pristionchus entomophagus]
VIDNFIRHLAIQEKGVECANVFVEGELSHDQRPRLPRRPPTSGRPQRRSKRRLHLTPEPSAPSEQLRLTLWQDVYTVVGVGAVVVGFVVVTFLRAVVFLGAESTNTTIVMRRKRQKRADRDIL